MEYQLINLTYEIELKPGEKLTLPESIVNSLGSGRWLIRTEQQPINSEIIRSHDAFLNGYVPEDEVLYDEYSLQG